MEYPKSTTRRQKNSRKKVRKTMNVNDFLGSGDILSPKEIEEAGGSLSLTVKAVGEKEYPDGKKIILHVHEIEKTVRLNATSVRAMAKMYGGENIDTAWVGKPFTVEVRETKTPTGQQTKTYFVVEQNRNQLALDAFTELASKNGYSVKDRRDFLARFPNDPVSALAELQKEIDKVPF